MNSYQKKTYHRVFFWFFFSLFVCFYPMIISIYVFFPLFIGVMGYLFIYGVENKQPIYVLWAFVYMVNLELNLSLPIFLMITSSLLFYLLFYFLVLKLEICKVCKALLSVVLLDFIYLGLLFGFDFVFQTQSIILDKLLLYSLFLDMLVVVVL